LRFFVYHACKFRLAPDQLTKIRYIEAEERALAHRDDRRIACTAGEQGYFAKKSSRPEKDRLGLQVNLNFARLDPFQSLASW
jgi:hypothetical protein